MVRLDHPSEVAKFYVGADDELVWFVWSAETTGGWRGMQPRHAQRTAAALPLAGPDGLLGAVVAWVPDHVVDAPELAALGVLENNVLVLPGDVEPGEVTVEVEGAPPFTLTTFNASDDG